MIRSMLPGNGEDMKQIIISVPILFVVGFGGPCTQNRWTSMAKDSEVATGTSKMGGWLGQTILGPAVLCKC